MSEKTECLKDKLQRWPITAMAFFDKDNNTVRSCTHDAFDHATIRLKDGTTETLPASDYFTVFPDHKPASNKPAAPKKKTVKKKAAAKKKKAK